MSLPSDICGDSDHGRECDAVTAQDKGTPWFGGTGHDSFLFYTSGINMPCLLSQHFCFVCEHHFLSKSSITWVY